MLSYILQKLKIFKPKTNKTEQPVLLTDGWTKTTLSSLFKIESIHDTYKHICKNDQWKDSISVLWLENIRIYSASELLKLSHSEKKSKSDKDSILDHKRLLTVSSIFYDFPIPSKLYFLDTITLEYLLQYTYLNEIVYVKKDMLASKIKVIEVFVKDIDYFVDRLLSNPAFKNLINKFADSNGGYKYLPNIYVLYDQVMKNFPGEDDFKKLDIYEFKKIVSCLFLSCGIAMPRNYVYVDQEVIDWLNSEGAYSIEADNVISLRKKMK